MTAFTHLDESGAARMVDVTAKQPTVREASASARVDVSPRVMGVLRTGAVPKGDVLAVARIAGIGAAKRVPDLLPLAHTIGVHGCEVGLSLEEDHVAITATVRTADRTGVEMEALTSVTVAALAVIDMVKGVELRAHPRREDHPQVRRAQRRVGAPRGLTPGRPHGGTGPATVPWSRTAAEWMPECLRMAPMV